MNGEMHQKKIENEGDNMQGDSPINDLVTTNGKLWVKVKMYSETLGEWMDITVRDEKIVTLLNMMMRKEESIPKFARAFREMGLTELK